MKLSILRLFIPASLLLASTSQGSVIAISNLSGGTQSFGASLSGPTANFGFIGGEFENRQVAFSFITGTDTVQLTHFSFSISVGDVNLDPILATLSTGSSVAGGINPVTIGSVAPVSPVPVGQIMSIVPASPIPLQANTNYWVHFTVPAGAGIYSINNGNAPVVEPGWTLGNTWYYEPDFGGLWTEVTSGPLARVRMTVETVPEPSGVLLGLAGGAMMLRRRRR